MTRAMLPAVLALFAATFAPPGSSGQTTPALPGPDELTTARVAVSLLAAHNHERAAKKLPPLTLDSKLTAAAQAHADDMARHHTMSHEGSDGSSPFDRIKRQRYHYQSAGENVAEGQETVLDVMDSWMTSPPHRANILGKFTQAGFAVALDDDARPYWCADFGSPFPHLAPAAASSEVVGLLNKERARAGLSELKPSARLDAAAARVARGLARAGTLDSGTARGPDIEAALKQSGYRYRQVAELAASGQPTAVDVVGSWMKNELDRKNVLGEFLDVGVGYARSDKDEPFWCLFLARPLRK